MVNLGKIQSQLFGGVFGATASFTSSASIFLNYILPVIRRDIESMPFGKIILFLLKSKSANFISTTSPTLNPKLAIKKKAK